MSLPIGFSMIFYISFVCYVLLGVYALWLNPKSMLNRVFFVATISLGVWAFCFSIANSTPTHGVSLLWRRMAVLGWGSAYSVLLHFFLILTERKRLLQSKWLYFILYMPVLVNIYIYGLSPKAFQQHELVSTEFGWVNISIYTTWDILFNIYFFTCSLIGFLLLAQWGITEKDRKKKRQSLLLFLAFALALIIGTTDLVLNPFFKTKVPQVSPTVSLIPMSVIFYSIKRYDLLKRPEREKIAEPGKILSEDTHTKVFQVVSLLFMLSAMIGFAIKYFFMGEPILEAIFLFMILFGIGNILQLIQHLSIKNETKDSIFILLIALAVPAIILEGLKEAGITVWAIPITFLMLAVIFNKRRMIYILGITIFLTQVLVWILAPTEMVRLDGVDYALRLLVIVVAFFIALYVNKIYIKRLEQNETQIKYQKMVSRVSTDFITATEFNLVDKIKNLLVASGSSLGVDRCSFYVFDEEQKTMCLRYEWCNKGIEPTQARVWNLPKAAYSVCMQQIQENEIVYIPDVDLLDPEVFVIKKELQERNIKTFVGVPVQIKGKELGLISYESIKEKVNWRKEQLNILEILVNILVDAIRKVEAEKELNYLAYYDSLTGLPNRSLFKNRLDHSIHLAKRTEKHIGVMFIDLDSFRGVNDSIGHGGGDELLKEVGARLASCVSKHDMVARFGGDKFLIQISDISQVEDIRNVAKKVLGIFKQPVLVREQEFFTGASMGIAVYPQDGEEAEELIKNAELAMYISKDKGKNQYTLCTPAIKDDLLQKVTLTNNLYRALERKELLLYYQPQVDINTEEIIGVEALLRWKHSELGMISPGLFIPLAEQTGLVHPIGQWVLETACRQLKEWQGMGLGPIRMSVNLSLVQFRNPLLVKTITKTLNKTGLDPKYLELEITESIAVEEGDSVIEVLHKLKDLGISIAIDDFGTEYSSLSRLKALPMDRIKIAMEFIHGITEEKSRDKVIAEIIIKLAKSLGLKVIAEGVETEAQVEFLSEQGCDEIQGYYYYKPMPKEEVEKLLKEGIKQAT